MNKVCLQTARWCVIGLGFTLPISVALDNILMGLAILGWLFAGDLPRRLREIRQHPVSWASAILAGVMLVGITWSPQPFFEELKESASSVLRFLLLGMFFTIFKDERTRQRALAAFLASSVLVLTLSFLLWSGLFNSIPGVKGSPDYPVVFKLHITHNVLMAVAVALFLVRAIAAQGSARWVNAGLAAAASFNILFMIPGRTGQIALACVLVYIASSQFRLRGFAVAGAALALVVATAWWIPSSVLATRAKVAIKEASAWQSEQAQPDVSSVGLRMEFYRNSLQMISQRPLFGSGTGSFTAAYADHVTPKGMHATSNPHNAYLMIGVELGLFGLAALAWLLVTQWRSAKALPDKLDCIAARSLILIFAIAGAVSSTFSDHVEGLFYVWASGLLWAGLQTMNQTGSES
jgi:O-antigen ligase